MSGLANGLGIATNQRINCGRLAQNSIATRLTQILAVKQFSITIAKCNNFPKLKNKTQNWPIIYMQKLIRDDCTDRPHVFTAIMHYNLNGLPFAHNYEFMTYYYCCCCSSGKIKNESHEFNVRRKCIYYNKRFHLILMWRAHRDSDAKIAVQPARFDRRRRSPAGHSLAAVNEWTNAGCSVVCRLAGIRKSAYCYFWDFVKMWNGTKLWLAHRTDWHTHTRRTAPKDNYDLAIERNGIRIFFEVKEILIMPIDAKSNLILSAICVFRATEYLSTIAHGQRHVLSPHLCPLIRRGINPLNRGKINV